MSDVSGDYGCHVSRRHDAHLPGTCGHVLTIVLMHDPCTHQRDRPASVQERTQCELLVVMLLRRRLRFAVMSHLDD